MKVILCILALTLTACSEERQDMCSYENDAYQYAKETKGKHSTEAINARAAAMECISRNFNSSIR